MRANGAYTRMEGKNDKNKAEKSESEKSICAWCSQSYMLIHPTGSLKLICLISETVVL